MYTNWYSKIMLSEYLAKKLKQARYKLLEDRSYFGEIPGLKGVWASAKNLEDCRAELQSALEDWLLFKLKDGDAIAGLEVSVNQKWSARIPEYAK